MGTGVEKHESLEFGFNGDFFVLQFEDVSFEAGNFAQSHSLENPVLDSH